MTILWFYESEYGFQWIWRAKSCSKSCINGIKRQDYSDFITQDGNKCKMNEIMLENLQIKPELDTFYSDNAQVNKEMTAATYYWTLN